MKGQLYNFQSIYDATRFNGNKNVFSTILRFEDKIFKFRESYRTGTHINMIPDFSIRSNTVGMMLRIFDRNFVILDARECEDSDSFSEEGISNVVELLVCNEDWIELCLNDQYCNEQTFLKDATSWSVDQKKIQIPYNIMIDRKCQNLVRNRSISYCVSPSEDITVGSLQVGGLSVYARSGLSRCIKFYKVVLDCENTTFKFSEVCILLPDIYYDNTSVGIREKSSTFMRNTKPRVVSTLENGFKLYVKDGISLTLDFSSCIIQKSIVKLSIFENNENIALSEFRKFIAEQFGDAIRVGRAPSRLINVSI